MENFNILPTKVTPKVTFNMDKKSLEFKGILCPENPYIFFTPIIEALRKYLNENTEMNFRIELDYFNSGSSKCLLSLFKTVADIQPIKIESTVSWITESNDEDLVEAGKLFEEITGLKFEYINN